jgi:hypothetical protein
MHKRNKPIRRQKCLSDKLKELLKDKEEVPGIRIVLSQGG